MDTLAGRLTLPETRCESNRVEKKAKLHSIILECTLTYATESKAQTTQESDLSLLVDSQIKTDLLLRSPLERL